MNNKLIVSPAPHIKSSRTTQNIMLDVVIALLPAVVVSVLVFGLRALALEAVCVTSCVFFEYIIRLVLKRSCTVGDLSAVVTGLLLAFNLPAGFPIWMAVVGSAVAIIIVKQLFGGIGCNFANPAIVGRIFLLISFSGAMTTWPAANSYISGIDSVSGATPLAILTTGGSVADVPSIQSFLFGIRGGCLGETCALALIIGGIYLIVRGVITPTIPVAFLATVCLMSLACGLDPLYQIVSGGALLGGIFMLTDYSTSPGSELGKLIFAVGAGIITMLIRAFGAYPEGMSFAILIMNIIAPHIDSLTRRKAFGGAAK